MKKIFLLATLLFGACSSNEDRFRPDKAIEDPLYNRAAQIVSDICAKVYDRGLWIQRTRAEARREIRQRGRYGPQRPNHLPDRIKDGLGKETMKGKGPVIRIYCEGEQVPDVVWSDLVRDWQD